MNKSRTRIAQSSSQGTCYKSNKFSGNGGKGDGAVKENSRKMAVTAVWWLAIAPVISKEPKQMECVPARLIIRLGRVEIKKLCPCATKSGWRARDTIEVATLAEININYTIHGRNKSPFMIDKKIFGIKESAEKLLAHREAELKYKLH